MCIYLLFILTVWDILWCKTIIFEVKTSILHQFTELQAGGRYFIWDKISYSWLFIRDRISIGYIILVGICNCYIVSLFELKFYCLWIICTVCIVIILICQCICEHIFFDIHFKCEIVLLLYQFFNGFWNRWSFSEIFEFIILTIHVYVLNLKQTHFILFGNFIYFTLKSHTHIYIKLLYTHNIQFLFFSTGFIFLPPPLFFLFTIFFSPFIIERRALFFGCFTQVNFTFNKTSPL